MLLSFSVFLQALATIWHRALARALFYTLQLRLPGPCSLVASVIFCTMLRSRLRHKQAEPVQLPTAVDDAIAWERALGEGEPVLAENHRPFHVHWTHVRTHNPQDVQPEAFKTRAQFWSHLLLCYKEAYPDASSPTGSIVQFGLVVKEKHKDAPLEKDRSEHHHCAMYTSQKHYWNKVVCAPQVPVHSTKPEREQCSARLSLIWLEEAVWEWCPDCFHTRPSKQPASESQAHSELFLLRYGVVMSLWGRLERFGRFQPRSTMYS